MIVVLKATLIFALALACALAAKRAAAATRHAMLAAAQAAALALPLLAFVVPPIAVKSVEAPRVLARGVAPASAPVLVLDRPEAGATPVRIDYLPLAWALGAAVILFTRTQSWLRARAIVRRARPFGGARISDEVDQPVTLGSHIVLPIAARDWDVDRLTAVMLHERAHVERRDSLLGVLADAACAVYWFHPLAWIVAARARIERERACDDAVLARGVAACTYAAALLDVARERSHGIAMAERSSLGERIRAILDPSRRHRGTRAARAVVVAAALAIAPVLAALTARGIEPDLRGDWIASPFSERLPDAGVVPAGTPSGPDAPLILQLRHVAAQPPRDAIDFVPARARWCLTQVRSGELVAPLIGQLSNSDWRVQAYAAWGLSVAGDRRATASLLPLLDHSVWRLRAMTASALANLADPAAANAMKRALDDDAWQVRREAVRYFAALGGHAELVEEMKNDRHMAVRAIAEETDR